MRNNGYMRLFDYEIMFVKEYNYLQNKEVED